MRCAVYGCNVDYQSKDFDHDIKFFGFPKGKTLQCVWKQLCKRADNFNINNARICSKHFCSSDYERNLKHELLGYSPKNYRPLKKESIPSKNLPKAGRDRYDSGREQRSAQRHSKKVVQTILKGNKPTKKSTVTYSDDVFEYFVKQQKPSDKLDDIDIYEDKDPLTLDSLNQETLDIADQTKISDTEQNMQSQVLQIKDEPDESMMVEEQLLQEDIVEPSEFIKIEIVENDIELPRAVNISHENLQMLMESQCLPTNKDFPATERELSETEIQVPSKRHKINKLNDQPAFEYFLIQPETGVSLAPEGISSASLDDNPLAIKRITKKKKLFLNSEDYFAKKNKIPIKRQNKDEQDSRPAIESTDLPAIELPLSQEDLSFMELGCTSNFNYSANLNDLKLLKLTGITNDILNVCEKCIENSLYTEDQISVSKNIRLKIVLVLMKLKSNLPCSVLGNVLGLEENTCGSIFYRALEMLSVALKPAVCWFTEKELMDGKNQCFIGNNFSRFRVILHELIFEVNKCQISQCKVKKCDQYKKHDSVRVLIGLSPKGNLFSYVSSPYDYKTAINFVLRREKLFSRLCSRSDIVVIMQSMVIRQMFEDSKREGIQIEILENQKKGIKDYANQTFQKLEEFEILKSKKISSHMVPFIGKAVYVICSVLNLRVEAENDDELT